ncbi:hypothetical protein [uncultured Cellulomonas sp.]|uniref:hypothetical protein n=1 Tax=uncultured Cellulomonas sp. TaxID=189682 RepID=UPI0028E8C61C|nr:hypothetical protein [uncultured Cellulomonas sp.]
MARDLHELMTDALARATGALADTADDTDRVSRMRAAVRRRRATRAAVRGTSAACVAVVVGATAWFGLRAVEDPTPAVTPSPTVTEPAPSPTPTATPTPSTPQTVLLPGLPAMPAATREIIAAATPGWVLLRYAGPVWPGEGPADAAFEQLPGFNALVLASPEGERFHVVDLPLDLWVGIDRWVAGMTTADVTVWSAESAQSWGTIDLLTGDVTTTPAVPAGVMVGWARSGERIVLSNEVEGRVGQGTVVAVDRLGAARSLTTRFLTDAQHAQLDPTGQRVVLHDRAQDWVGVVVDVATGEAWTPGGMPWPGCTTTSWIDERWVLVQCQEDPVARPTYWRVNTDPTGEHAVPVLGAAETYPQGDGVPTGDGGVAFTGSGTGDFDTCRGSLYVWWSSTDSTERLDTDSPDDPVVPWTGTGGDVYATTMPVCVDVAMPALSRIVAATGATTSLLPVDWMSPVSGAMESFAVGVAP